MTVAKFSQPDKTAQQAEPGQYAADIDASINVMSNVAAAFAPHEADTPDMTVVLDSGKMISGQVLTNVGQQVSAVITAPVTDPRIDRIVIDSVTGVLQVISGLEAVTPVPPSIPESAIAIAQILLTVSTTSITNSIISDERPAYWVPMIDQDDMSSNSDKLIPSQQSVKQYADRKFDHRPGYLFDTSGASSPLENIPAWVRKIIINISHADSGDFFVSIGTAAGWESSGYTSRADGPATPQTATNAFVIANGGSDVSGEITLTNTEGDTWVLAGTLIDGNSNLWICGGVKTLADTLDKVDFWTGDSSGSFNDGAISYELQG